MNCRECRDLLVEYAEELLEEAQKQAVNNHLDSCPDCRSEQQLLLDLQNSLRENGREVRRIDLEDRVFNQILREQHNRLKGARMAGLISLLRSLFMKNPYMKIAATAATVVIVLIVMFFSQSNVTFARVVEPILKSRTVAFDLIIGNEEKGFAARDIVIDSKIRRTVPKLHNVLIMDLDNSRMLVLDTKSKGAVYINIKGFMAEGQRDVLNLVRNAVSAGMQNPKAVVEELGMKTVGDRKAVGFHISDSGSETTIWADPDTSLPIRIELKVGGSPYILKNIEFNVPLDKSLVSMEVPPGYTVAPIQGDWSDFSEKDFRLVLRIFAQYIQSGEFPDNLDLEDIAEVQPPIAKMAKPAGMTEEETMDILMSYGKGIVFLSELAANGAQWRYTGRGVKFGNADKIVFWYRPKDSKSCRAIYGDLHGEDVSCKDLLP